MKENDDYQSEVSNPNQQIESVQQNKLMTFDEALLQVGAANKYQKIIFFYFGFQWFFAKFILYYLHDSNFSWILLSPVYLFFAPSVNCKGDSACQIQCPHSDSFLDRNCEEYICSLVSLSSQKQKDFLYGESIVTAFDQPLVCGLEEIANIVKAQTYVGSLIGFFIFSFVADNYGRKLGIGFSWFAAFIGCVILGLSINIEMVGIGMFLTGFGVNPAITIHYSIVNEHTLGHFRDIQNIGIQAFQGFGELAFIPVAYYFPYWKYMSLLWFGIPIGLLNLPILYLEESPKFLYPKDKQKAVKVLNRIAKKNNREPVDYHQVESCKQASSNKQKVYTVVDLVRYKSLRWNFICGLGMFYAIQAIYYGISFAADKIGLNLYINSLIIAFAETLAYCVTDNFIVNLLRRKSIIIGFIITCSMAFTYIFLNPPSDCGTICFVVIIQIILAASMRFLICAVWSLTYIYLSELFPTVVRSLALGIISAGGTIGSISCPFLVTFSNRIKLNPLITLGIIGLFGAILTYPLKETYGQALQDEIEEEKVWRRVYQNLKNRESPEKLEDENQDENEDEEVEDTPEEIKGLNGNSEKSFETNNQSNLKNRKVNKNQIDPSDSGYRPIE